MKRKAIITAARAPVLPALLLLLALPIMAMGGGESELLAGEEFRGINALRIESESFDVNIVGNRTASTSAQVYGSRSVSATISRRGDTVLIEAKERRALFSRSRVPGVIEIETFEGVDIEVESGSGDVDVRGLQGGALDVRTGSGDVVARAIFGDLRLRSGSGEFEMERVGGSVEAGSGSGDISLSDGEGRISVNTSSGDIEIRGVSGDVEATSSSGDVSVADAEGVFDLSSTSGAVTGEELEPRSASTFRSVSGDIRLELRNDPARYAYQLRTVSGSIRVGDSEAGNRFERDGGTVLIEANTTSGSINVE